MKRLLGLILRRLLATPARWPYFARGEFDAWAETPTYQLTDNGGGFYSTTIGGFFTASTLSTKLQPANRRTGPLTLPTTTAKIATNADGEIN